MKKVKVKNRLPQTNTTIASQGIGISNDQVKEVIADKEVTGYINSGRLVKADEDDVKAAAKAEAETKKKTDAVKAAQDKKAAEKKAAEAK